MDCCRLQWVLWWVVVGHASSLCCVDLLIVGCVDLGEC
jgi:hypothetical protein